MAKFHPLKVADIRRETTDCVSVAFEIPEQFQNEYQYIQGQYVTLKLIIDGEEVRRSYSISSSPLSESELRIAAKKVNNGKVSTYLSEKLKAGDVIEVMTPMGNFHSALSDNNQKHYVLFAGGSGITPMFSIIKSVLKAEPKSTITLLYGNLNEDSIIFNSSLALLASEHTDRLRIFHILDQPAQEIPALHKGIMTTEKVKELISNYVDMNLTNEFFICGPTPMMQNVESTLAELNVPRQQIHLEYFTAALEAGKEKAVNSGEEITAQVTIIIDGEETVLELSSEGMPILDAAIEADLDVPFACKGAVCCTCRAKVLEGEVTMDANFALTPEEVSEGFILTCQSHPKTATVVVDYDV